jgi:hypothetical protein
VADWGFEWRPQPVDNFVENLPSDGLRGPRRALRIGSPSYYWDIKVIKINNMLRVFVIWRAIWQLLFAGSRHVDTFNNSSVGLDADGHSVYRLSGQSQSLLA